MTMTATSTNAKAPAGLYTVPVGSNETLRKGVAKLQFKVTSPVMKKATAFVFSSKTFWDRVAIPAMNAALKAKGVTNLRFPSGNFYADSAGVTKQAPLAKVPAGFKYYPRKGYDPVTGVAFLWVVVS
ncbi:hypothetical protein CBQ26_13385 [Deinococcus indicus]|uniref:Uncharacterized protein n=3 Tax=Deinococcus TaxID=1298 RepID=A0A246BIF4_9DEIO|nr:MULTISPECIES: hypothetical protein [Deinococcus]MCD0174745.1 hypothetical protein [Deinococcus sp. 14RED07]OWL95042.1 hypothetical protein CBQ26_13385 [Deinococcus indicus]